MGKLNEVTKVTTMNAGDYIPFIQSDGNIGQIKKSDLAKVLVESMPAVNKTVTKGIIDRKSTALYDAFGPTSSVYPSLKITTNIPIHTSLNVSLDIREILSWNYSGNISFSVRIRKTSNGLYSYLSRNNITSGLISSIYSYFDSNNYLCFHINFKAETLNISNGFVLLSCCYNNGTSPYTFCAENTVLKISKEEKYIAGTNPVEAVITL